MSLTSLQLPALPSYQRSPLAPAYSRVPLENEQRLTFQVGPERTPALTSFRKESKTGSVTLELYNQREDINCPIYNQKNVITGKVVLQKRDSVSNVAIKLEGILKLQEIGGAGRNTDRVLAKEVDLWTRADQSVHISPGDFEFAIEIPSIYLKDGKEYPLPPSLDFHLNGVPGFKADVVYTITVHVSKSKGNLFGNHTIVSTPFIYFPRLRPLHPIPPPPPPSTFSSSTVRVGPEWESIEATMGTYSRNIDPILVKLFLPTGRTYSMQTPIPFRLLISASATSLASFLPCSPTSYEATERNSNVKSGSTRVFVIRQVSVDAKNAHKGIVKTDIFKSLLLGEGKFRRLNDGADWATWEGEITLDPSEIKVGSFKVPGLWLRDLLVLSITPPNPRHSPLKDLRKMIPIRIVTDLHASQAEVDQLSEWWDGDIKLEIPES